VAKGLTTTVTAAEHKQRKLVAVRAAQSYAGCRPFGWSGESDRCRWCNRKLGIPRPGVRSDPRTTVGAYGDGYFCTLACGYAFGTEMATERQFPPETKERR